MKRLLLAGLFLVLTGCGVNSTFSYRPNPSEEFTKTFPVKIAVLPFRDGTAENTRQDSSLRGYVNLAKTGIDYGVAVFPPNRWGKAFADELAASAKFQAVRFVSDISEGDDDEIIVAGTVTKADVPIPGGSDPVRFAVILNARIGRDKPPFWNKVVSRENSLGVGYALGCGLDRQCAIDQRHAHHNNLLREMFLEARVDLSETLSSRSGSRGKESSAQTPESVDETIEFILKGQ
ncbi:MAG: hypothetical protein CVU69_13125 [Deltaproteobacteria bacterium HGW-Deltaproteobacteria-4]|nr:MAG: hypothetical protein CVU69_13125 [Deltaproteobacteria bacterium HGW-Deltaproteobacteria-4]